MNEPDDVHIESKYLDYNNEVLKEISEKKLQDRYHRLLVSAQEFIKEMGYQEHVFCNETMLMFAVLGYYSDIMRLKDFHKIDNEHDTKALAYEVTWLLKRRPLQILNSNDQKYIFCNEQFAFSQITYWLKKNDGDMGTEALSELKFFSNTLFYHLKYRSYEPQTLELMLVSFMAGRKYQHILSPR